MSNRANISNYIEIKIYSIWKHPFIYYQLLSNKQFNIILEETFTYYFFILLCFISLKS